MLISRSSTITSKVGRSSGKRLVSPSLSKHVFLSAWYTSSRESHDLDFRSFPYFRSELTRPKEALSSSKRAFSSEMLPCPTDSRDSCKILIRSSFSATRSLVQLGAFTSTKMISDEEVELGTRIEKSAVFRTKFVSGSESVT